jgi:hypothetical protein
MIKIRKMPAFGWFVIGVLATLVVVPTAAYAAAAALKFTGIEGTSGNQADVTSAHQLLTAEASPSQFVSYETVAYGADGGTDCVSIATVPAGDSLIVQDVEADISQADPPQYSEFVNNLGDAAYSEVSGASFAVDYGATECNFPFVYLVSGDAPAGGVGDVTDPIQPGSVLTAGTKLWTNVIGMNVIIYVSGYLVPSADAPTITAQASTGARPGSARAHHLLTTRP